MRSTLHSFYKIKFTKGTLKTKVSPSTNNINIKKDEYSTHRVCNYDPSNTDVKASTNNNPQVVIKMGKVVRHMEVHVKNVIRS